MSSSKGLLTEAESTRAVVASFYSIKTDEMDQDVLFQHMLTFGEIARIIYRKETLSRMQSAIILFRDPASAQACASQPVQQLLSTTIRVVEYSQGLSAGSQSVAEFLGNSIATGLIWGHRGMDSIRSFDEKNQISSRVKTSVTKFDQDHQISSQFKSNVLTPMQQFNETHQISSQLNHAVSNGMTTIESVLPPSSSITTRIPPTQIPTFVSAVNMAMKGKLEKSVEEKVSVAVEEEQQVVFR